MSWIIGRSAGSTQPFLGRVSLSLHSYQNPQFGMTINNIPLLEIKDFGPPARGGHFVLFHSFLPPQPYGTQFHAVHTSPVQLVSLAHLSLFLKTRQRFRVFRNLVIYKIIHYVGYVLA